MTTPPLDLTMQQEAARKAENYRAIETRINAHLKTFDGKKLTPADKKHVSQQQKLAQQNRSRANQWQAQADGNANA